MCRCQSPVHSEPEQQDLAVLPGGQDPLVETEPEEAVPEHSATEDRKV